MKSWTKSMFTFLLVLTGAIMHFVAVGQNEKNIQFSFLGKEYAFKLSDLHESIPQSLSHPNSFTEITNLLENNFGSLVPELVQIKKSLQLSDWYTYQLIRKLSQQIIPKESDYWGYTYCKWYLLSKCGFNPILCTMNDKLLLYIQSNSTIYNIPIKMLEGNQYVCLNYHDYNFDIPLDKETPAIIHQTKNENRIDFNYEIVVMPELPKEQYTNKTIAFDYKNKHEMFEIKVFPGIKDYFINYPVTDYRFQFNIPLSKITYASIVLPLKKKLADKTIAFGVEYIMFLVRNAFAYEADSAIYGREKRFSPEETLAADWSDCEDHAGLFFSLVREVYNLPMVVISYPDHVNVGVALETPVRKSITYHGKQYTICEPTPQKKRLYLGQTGKKMSKQPFEVVYAYEPQLD